MKGLPFLLHAEISSDKRRESCSAAFVRRRLCAMCYLRPSVESHRAGGCAFSAALRRCCRRRQVLPVPAFLLVRAADSLCFALFYARLLHGISATDRADPGLCRRHSEVLKRTSPTEFDAELQIGFSSFRRAPCSTGSAWILDLSRSRVHYAWLSMLRARLLRELPPLARETCSPRRRRALLFPLHPTSRSERYTSRVRTRLSAPRLLLPERRRVLSAAVRGAHNTGLFG